MPRLPLGRRGSPRGPVSILTTSAGAAALAAGLLSAPASADLTDWTWFGPQEFSVRITHMPDFDQRRVPGRGLAGLPGGGNMYCVPTGVMNLAGYAANHGSQIGIAPAYWQGQSSYGYVTDVINLLGIVGGTTTTGGTGLNGMRDQAEILFPSSQYTVTVDGANASWAPKVHELAEMVRNGAIVSFCHGWYAFEGDQVVRNGGHCVTFTRAFHGIFDQKIFVRDPADSSGDAVQSTFVDRAYTFADSVYATPSSGTKLMSRIVGSPGESAVRLIDGYCMVKPKYAATFAPGSNGLQITYAANFFPVLSGDVEIEPPGPVIDIVAGPAHARLYAVIQSAFGSPTLFCTPLVDPEWVLVPVPMPSNPQIAIAGDRSLLVLGGGELQQVLLDDEEPDVIASVAAPIDGLLAVDRRTSRTFVLDRQAGRLLQFGRELGAPTGINTIPGPSLEPVVSIDWDETRDGLWILDPTIQGQLSIARFVAGAGFMSVDTVELPGLVEPKVVQADDAGCLMIIDSGIWKAYSVSEEGIWFRDGDAPFDGTSADARSFVSTGRTNFDPDVHGTEAWRNVLPETFGEPVADCLADVDGDDVIGFDDLLAVLAGWGPCPAGAFCSTDVDGDGATGFGDLLAVLAAWGDCP